MKKSSFLHNPKDMLSKSFKPAKCKMSLKLAASRLKLLKNKKEVQVKQMKKELAQLLDSGQEQTARIRVEHVIREEKMMAAYDLIEIYCELIVARLPIIETQKNCPIDLKEAITSVIFASPRCGDIPELLDVRKHLTAKYGKEFTTAAIELRPDCGVSRMLVEKLSAKAPDGQVKIKALTAIAEEHNIKWDPKAFGESQTLPNDLLNGPSTFENASKMQAEPPHFVPNAPAPRSHHNQPVSYSEQNVRPSHATQNLPTQLGGVSNVVSSNLQPEKKHSGARADRAEIKQEFHREAGAFSSGQQSWNMEFKDATSAAQAAAESAERASMAARAAAELSSRGRISRQHSSESHKSDVNICRDEGTRKHSTSKLINDYPKDSTNVSFAERQTRVPDEQNTVSERPYQDDYGGDIRSAQTFSSRSKGSLDKDLFVHNVRGSNEYSQNSLSKEEEMEIHSDESEAEYENHQHEGFSPEKFDYYGERTEKQPSVRIEIQPSAFSSGSHSSVPRGDDEILNSGNRMFGHDFGEYHSAGIDKHMHKDSFHSGSHDSGGVIFDDSGSDGEDFGFDAGSHHEEFPSPNRNLAAHLSADSGTGSLFETSNSKQRSESEFSPQRNSFREFSGAVEKTIDSSQPDNSGPVTFDESDGQSSEDETDMGHSWLHGTRDATSLHGKENLSLGSTRLSLAEKHWKNEQRTEASVGPPQNFGSGEAPPSQSSPIREKSQLEPNDSDSDSDGDSEVNRHNSSLSKFSLVNEVNDINSHGSEINDENSGYGGALNLDKLTGGLRHKGYTRPPYIRSQLDNISSLSRKRGEESPAVISGASPAVEGSSAGNSQVFGNARRSRVPDSSYDSDSDSSEEFEKQLSTHGREPYIGSTNKDVKEKSNSRGPVTYFHFESSDSEDDDSAKQVFTGRSHLGTGVSRRTKASASHLKGHSSSVVLEASDSVAERSSTRRYYSAETQPSQSEKKHSGPGRDLQQSSSGKLGSKTTMESKISSHDKNRESYGVEQPPNSKPTPESSGSAERSSTTRFYSAETPQPSQSQKKHSGPGRDLQQSSSGKLGSKTTMESKISSHDKNRESYGVEQPPNSKPTPESSGSAERSSTTRFYSAETPQPSQSQKKHSGPGRDLQQSSSGKLGSKTTMESKISSHDKNREPYGVEQPPNSKPTPESSRGAEAWKISSLSSINKEDSGKKASHVNPKQKLEASGGAETRKISSRNSINKEDSGKKDSDVHSKQNPEASDSNKPQKTASGNSITREDSGKKASHVHPKLPDYDTLAARMQALRTNHQ